MTALLGSRIYAPESRRAWHARFPQDASGPALQVVEISLPAREVLVQVLAESVVRPVGAA